MIQIKAIHSVIRHFIYIKPALYGRLELAKYTYFHISRNITKLRKKRAYRGDNFVFFLS
jgi:hypothetical protein